MKRCPECRREYDRTMMFCLDDGAELLYGPASASSIDEPATAILSEPGAVATGSPELEPPTRAQNRTAIFPGREAQPRMFGESSGKAKPFRSAGGEAGEE